MQRLLPPLLVLTVLGLVAVRTLLEPAREEAQQQIAGLIQGSEFERAHAALGEYSGRFGGTGDHWFAARMLLRMGQPDRAVDAVWKDARLASAPGTARRFARIALYTLGWEDEARDQASSMEPLALLALVEGGDPWARERLTQHASTLDLPSMITYFFPAFRQASSPPMAVIVDALRLRDTEKFGTAAALGALRPEDYAGKAADLQRLIDVVGSSSWRRQFRDVWCVACLSLGRSGDPRALEALQQTEARLEGSQRRRDREDLLLVRNGLLAAGAWDTNASLAEHALGAEAAPLPTVWYGEALIHRYRRGDTRAERALRDYWLGPGARFPDLRHRQVRAFLLQDDPPSDEAASSWVETKMLPELAGASSPPMERVLAQAYRLRSGQPDALAGLLDLVRTLGRTLGRPGGGQTGPLLEALRALYLYG